jgi:hypothetical protein
MKKVISPDFGSSRYILLIKEIYKVCPKSI